jgi:hypothetical protein
MLSCLRSSLNESYRKGAGLRLRLRLAAAPELGDLPWEFLYDPTLNQFIVLSVETPLVRYLDLPEDIEPLPVNPPLQVLVMISSPMDYMPLDVEREWDKLNEALGDLQAHGLVSLTRLENATLASLQRQLRRSRYHIFHFIGHGGFDSQAQDGVLLTEDENGRGRPVSGYDLGTLLHDHRTLRLAVLNACEGARSSRSDPFAGVAQSLVQKGLPAVIAMQFEITDPAAITLAHEFYGAIADGYPVDAALAEARKAVFAQDNDVEWATPVLYLRVSGAAIFKIETGAEQADLQSKIPPPQSSEASAVVEQFPAPGPEKLRPVPQPELQTGHGRAELEPGNLSGSVRSETHQTGLGQTGINQKKPTLRSRAVLFSTIFLLLILFSFIAFQYGRRTSNPGLPVVASEPGVVSGSVSIPTWTPAAALSPTQPAEVQVTPLMAPAGEQIPLDELTSIDQIEPLLHQANIRLSEPEDLERTRSYFYGPESAYHMLAVASLKIVGDRRFSQPVNLDIVDKWYTYAAGSGYADRGPLDLNIVEQSLIDAHNDYYSDNATSLEALLESRN